MSTESTVGGSGRGAPSPTDRGSGQSTRLRRLYVNLIVAASGALLAILSCYELRSLGY
jgi:hypothetical protein